MDMLAITTLRGQIGSEGARSVGSRTQRFRVYW